MHLACRHFPTAGAADRLLFHPLWGVGGSIHQADRSGAARRALHNIFMLEPETNHSIAYQRRAYGIRLLQSVSINGQIWARQRINRRRESGQMGWCYATFDHAAPQSVLSSGPRHSLGWCAAPQFKHRVKSRLRPASIVWRVPAGHNPVASDGECVRVVV